MTPPPDSESRQQIARAYSELIRKGYFASQLGGNEWYVGPLMTHQVPQSAKSLLEIGGATGLWAEQLVHARPALTHITAVEFSDAAAAYQSRVGAALKERPDAHLTVLQSDFLVVADQLEPADVVVSSFAAQYMGDPSAFLRRLVGLTRPGGRVIFADVLTHARSAGSGLSTNAMLESVVLLVRAYLREGLAPPILGLLRSFPIYGLYTEDSFKTLDSYHTTYQFPCEAWEAEQRAYPGAKFHNLGVAGVLVLPKG